MKAPILTCVALLTLPAVEDSPKFVRAEADVVSSAWTLVTTRKTESAVMTLTGNDQDVGSDKTVVTTLSLELLDEFTAVTEEGKPLEISRTYETLSRDVESDSADGEGVTNVFDEGPSELEGQSVTFAYDQDSRRVVRRLRGRLRR